MVSLIVPAHNEAAVLGETLRVLRASADALARGGTPYELIVVDDDSSDETPRIARQYGATLVQTIRRQIAGARNVGAAAARGGVLIFVDADTHVPPETLRAAVAAIEEGAVGGGARLRADERTPFWLAKLALVTIAVMSMFRWAAGCFFFVRRDAFVAVGGFDERYFATEEIVLSRALKRRGRMVIVREPVTTSGRKGRMYGAGLHLAQLWRLVRGGRRALQRREGLDLWYEGRRE